MATSNRFRPATLNYAVPIPPLVSASVCYVCLLVLLMHQVPDANMEMQQAMLTPEKGVDLLLSHFSDCHNMGIADEQ